jgi:hypothetical protein
MKAQRSIATHPELSNQIYHPQHSPPPSRRLHVEHPTRLCDRIQRAYEHIVRSYPPVVIVFWHSTSLPEVGQKRCGTNVRPMSILAADPEGCARGRNTPEWCRHRTPAEKDGEKVPHGCGRALRRLFLCHMRILPPALVRLVHSRPPRTPTIHIYGLAAHARRPPRRSECPQWPERFYKPSIAPAHVRPYERARIA